MKKLTVTLLFLALFLACSTQKTVVRGPYGPENTEQQPFNEEVLKTAVIYEANVRQYSPEGTFEAFTRDIPGLKNLGV